VAQTEEAAEPFQAWHGAARAPGRRPRRVHHRRPGAARSRCTRSPRSTRSSRACTESLAAQELPAGSASARRLFS
jgi:hypothetical protein